MSHLFTENTAMETFLHQLVENKQFDLLSNKNWDAISNMFPGTTPYQVSCRFYADLKDLTTSVRVLEVSLLSQWSA